MMMLCSVSFPLVILLFGQLDELLVTLRVEYGVQDTVVGGCR